MNKTCTDFRRAVRSGAATLAEKRHLFCCAECRADARLLSAWKAFPRPEDLETRPAPDDVFLERVLRDVRADRRHRARVRAGLAAAAALLFFFLAGAAGQLVSSASTTSDDAYAQLVAASDSDPVAASDSELVTPSEGDLETILAQ